MGEARPTVVIADDDVLLREGMASLLAGAEFTVAGQAGDADHLLELVIDSPPDLVITDIRMPPTHTTEGLSAAREIRDRVPGTAILVLSGHVDVEHATTLLHGGKGIGYLLKSRVVNVDDFLSTLRQIIDGAAVVDPAIVQELLSVRRHHDLLENLSDREREVLTVMAEGRSNAAIAQRLWISEGTVEKHVRSILTRFDLPASNNDHRRVLAVIRFLENR